MLIRKITSYIEEQRRKHQHWLATLRYSDGETFGRVYIDRKKANKFAERQKKSLLVKKTRIRRLRLIRAALPTTHFCPYRL